jgi:hypothetical protein
VGLLALHASEDAPLDDLLGILHDLEGKLVGTEPIVIPPAHSIRHAEPPIYQEVGILALVLLLGSHVSSLNEHEWSILVLVILFIVFLPLVVEE